jgi:regulatory protein
MRSPERSNERLAPVSYLPWAAPDAAEPSASTALEAENRLTRALRTRSLSAREAEDLLNESELEADAAQEILDRFIEYGYIDDAKLAEQIVHTHHERKGLGRSAVAAEMRRRRIGDDVIAEALEELDVDESGPAAVLAEQRVGRMGSLDDETAQRRLLGFLMRKGYSSSVARAAVKQALEHRHRA